MQHQPDFENLRRTILRQGPPGPVPFFELFADPGMVEAVLGEPFPVDLHPYIEEPILELPADELPGLLKSMEMYVRFCREVGYDYVFMVTPSRLRPIPPGRRTGLAANATGRSRPEARSKPGQTSRPTRGRRPRS
jgi:hypothetical protein